MSVHRLKKARGSFGFVPLVTLNDLLNIRKRLRKGVRGAQLEFKFVRKDLTRGVKKGN